MTIRFGRILSGMLSLILGACASMVLAQDAPTPTTPPVPSATTAPASPPQAPSREAQLETRLRGLEEMNRKILEQYQAMEKRHNERYDALSRQFQDLQKQVQVAAPATKPAADGDSDAGGDSGNGNGNGGDSDPDGDQNPEGPEGTIGRGTDSMGEEKRGGGAGGTDGDRVGSTPYTSRGVSDTAGGDTTRGGGPGRGAEGTIGRRGVAGDNRPVKVSVGNGLRFETDDEEFQLQFHNLTQAEYRFFPGIGGQSPLKDQFAVPRQRWYFTGRASKYVEYYTDVNRGYGALDILDAFINFNPDPRFQTRIGRFKTPTSYEYYQITEGDLIAPERSLFTSNLSGNREVGVMEHGQILDKTAEYSIGLFNGPRRSFTDFNSGLDLYTLFNIRPFQKSKELTALNFLNIGGEYDFGNEANPTVQPSILTTANDQSANTSTAVVRSLSPTFFAFNSNVVENGPRVHASAWLAWYYKSFNILAQYDGGFQDYSLVGARDSRVRVGQQGFFIQPYYFLTGEQIKRRVDIEPNKPLSIKNGKLVSIGAVEVHGRYSVLNLSENVFTHGLADPNLWSNHAQTFDVGFNWYPYKYTKIYFDWQHSIFGTPIYNGPGSRVTAIDLLWVRCQLFF